MVKNTGKNFENEVRRSLKAGKQFWFRIQDTNDVSKFVEIGPGKVLTGLVKRINKDVKIVNINSISDIKNYINQ